jgi:hypothetical protein
MPALTARLKTFVRNVLTPRNQMQSIFAPFYSEKRWGGGETVSGPGSTLERTAKLRRELPILLEEIGARTLLDAPCGDFNWITAATCVAPWLKTSASAGFAGNGERAKTDPYQLN